jgi:hypothetical protein
MYWADQSFQWRIKVSCTGTTSPTNQPRKDPFHLYALSPHSPQFQQSAVSVLVRWNKHAFFHVSENVKVCQYSLNFILKNLYFCDNAKIARIFSNFPSFYVFANTSANIFANTFAVVFANTVPASTYTYAGQWGAQEVLAVKPLLPMDKIFSLNVLHLQYNVPMVPSHSFLPEYVHILSSDVHWF